MTQKNEGVEPTSPEAIEEDKKVRVIDDRTDRRGKPLCPDMSETWRAMMARQYQHLRE